MKAVNDDYEGDQTDQEEKKFCCCLSLKQGYNIIGTIEVILTIWQIVTMFAFSARMGITCLLVFQLPLLITYV